MAKKAGGVQVVLVMCLVLVVLLGLHVVELTLEENGQLNHGPLFPRVSIGEPGQYHFHGFGKELEVALVYQAGQVTRQKDGLLVKVGPWEFYVPLKVNLLGNGQ